MPLFILYLLVYIWKDCEDYCNVFKLEITVVEHFQCIAEGFHVTDPPLSYQTGK